MKDDPFDSSELTTILVVEDMEASVDWYVNKLGAELYRQYGGSSTVLNFLDNWILLVTPGGPTEDKPSTSFSPPSDPKTVSHSFTIRVKDCKHSYEVLSNRGIQFITPPFSREHEIRCFFRDPDGHLFEISEYIP